MNNNLIESINLLRKNKKNFVNNEDYLKILTNLYNEISQKNLSNSDIKLKELDGFNDIGLEDFTKDEKNKIFDDILSSFNFESILKIKNINKLVIINPLFELLFVENKLIELNANKKYYIQTEPIFTPYNKKIIVDIIKVLLKICDYAIGCRNKIIISIIIFDTLFKNFKFIIDHIDFAITVKNKLIEFKKDSDKFNELNDSYNLEKNILDKWCELIDGINYE